METSSNIEIAEEMMSVAKVTRFTFAALILYIRQHQPKRERQRARLAWRNALMPQERARCEERQRTWKKKHS